MFRLNALHRSLVALAAMWPVLSYAITFDIKPSPPISDQVLIGDSITFEVTNKTPVTLKLDAPKVVNGEITNMGCKGELRSGATCAMTVIATSSGYLYTQVFAEGGKKSSKSDDIVVGPFRFGAFNLSFDRPTYQELLDQLTLTREKQEDILKLYSGNTRENKDLAEAIMQIRNVAEIIQRTRPDVFVLAEFNNNGTGTDNAALEGFQTNYLAYAKPDDVKSIHYSYMKNIPTNTGKMSGYDLNRDGKVNEGPDDAWGYGVYHGQYAFAVFSRFPFDDANYRTFQNFKWHSMTGEENIKIDCVEPYDLPDDLECGDAWYSKSAWDNFPLSSKNHIDLPVILPGNQIVHFLVSHPAPPIFNNPANHNTKRNRAEVDFWNDYIASKDYFYDDNGKKGGLPKGAMFVIAGDLNADPDYGDGMLKPINDLLNNALVNSTATLPTQPDIPKSNGAEYFLKNNCPSNRDCSRDYGNTITSVSTLRLDYVIPSRNLAVRSNSDPKSGVFWPMPGEPGDSLVSGSKAVSSDHRLVWIDLIPVKISPASGK